jgi:hypothetical protein
MLANAVRFLSSALGFDACPVTGGAVVVLNMRAVRFDASTAPRIRLHGPMLFMVFVCRGQRVPAGATREQVAMVRSALPLRWRR